MTVEERLSEAEAALHKLALGQGVVEVRDSNGDSVRYQQAKRGDLVAYIEDLRRQAGTAGAFAPMQFWGR